VTSILPSESGSGPGVPDLATLRLHIATLYRAGLAQRLIDRFGDAAAVFERSDAELFAVERVSPRALARLRASDARQGAERERAVCERHDVACLVRGTPGYPAALAPLTDMPLVLFCRGALAPIDACAVGIVGSRRASPYGLRQAARFAARFAELGVTVVSGLARGIDARAQEAALDAGGRTIALLGSGLGRLYPPEHRRLAERIVAAGAGAIVSEFPWSIGPRSFHFPQRNRLLSGLSTVLLVIEAGRKSGSLITVRWALDQGKSVFVVPGRIDDEGGRGGLELLREGAAPAVEPEDLFGELGLQLGQDGASSARPRRPASNEPLPGPLGEPLGRLFAQEDEWHPDEIVAQLERPAGSVLAALAELELGGHLHRSGGGKYARERRLGR